VTPVLTGLAEAGYTIRRPTMRRMMAAVAFLALAVPLTRADEKDDAAKKLEGAYEVVSVTVAGKPDDAKKDEVTSFEIKDKMLLVKVKDRDESVKFTLDPSKKPAHIDITPKGDKDEVVKGIYATKETDKGLELTVAFSMEGPNADRPKDFDGRGEHDIVIKLLRKKAK
jgi:uncharacterized protein (TIGR03067 family)